MVIRLINGYEGTSANRTQRLCSRHLDKFRALHESKLSTLYSSVRGIVMQLIEATRFTSSFMSHRDAFVGAARVIYAGQYPEGIVINEYPIQHR